MDSKSLGEYGEAIAKKYLENRGYTFETQNFHSVGGEIDLIMKNPQKKWVFIEVKTRRSTQFGSAKDSINKRKIQKMTHAIYHFFNTKKFKKTPDFCIEAICLRITGNRVFCEHIKDIS